MAIHATINTIYGENRPAYIRLNNVEASNHGTRAVALFRGFVSREAFEAGKGFVWEHQVEFTADVSQPIWAQGYAALRALPEMAGAKDA